VQYCLINGDIGIGSGSYQLGEKMTKQLKIHSALYTCQGWSKNVKSILKDNITEYGTLTLPVMNDYFGGDFYAGWPKELWITYTYNGISESLKLNEGEILTIPPRLKLPKRVPLWKRLLAVVNEF
jgi:hypothetical protein